MWNTKMHAQVGDEIEGHADEVYGASFSSCGRHVVSGYSDTNVRVWNASTHERIGEALHGNSESVGCVSESADGRHITSGDAYNTIIIWEREARAIVWKSKNVECPSQSNATDYENGSGTDAGDGKDASENEITNDEAEAIIRSCGQGTPHLWPYFSLHIQPSCTAMKDLLIPILITSSNPKECVSCKCLHCMKSLKPSDN